MTIVEMDSCDASQLKQFFLLFFAGSILLPEWIEILARSRNIILKILCLMSHMSFDHIL